MCYDVCAYRSTQAFKLETVCKELYELGGA